MEIKLAKGAATTRGVRNMPFHFGRKIEKRSAVAVVGFQRATSEMCDARKTRGKVCGTTRALQACRVR